MTALRVGIEAEYENYPFCLQEKSKNLEKYRVEERNLFGRKVNP
jgi:hypothetical protein